MHELRTKTAVKTSTIPQQKVVVKQFCHHVKTLLIMQLPLQSKHLGNYDTFAFYHKQKIAEKDDKLINQHPKF